MDVLRIESEGAGWCGKWAGRDAAPTGNGWEAVSTVNRAIYEVRHDGVRVGRVVARDRRSGRPLYGEMFQAELDAQHGSVVVGEPRLSPFGPCEALVAACAARKAG